MLVLSRKPSESFVFPTLGISVEVLRSGTGKVQLGINAPKEITVLRGELVQGPPSWKGDVASGILAAERAELEYQVSDTMNLLASIRSQTGEEVWHELEPLVMQVVERLNVLDSKVKQLAEKEATSSKLKTRVLLVNDNVTERRLLSSFLSMRGLDVSIAADGVAALKRLHEQTHDVVLLDINLPKLDGRWTIERIRDEPAFAQLKIFAASGHTPETLNLTVGPHGVNKWFLKPLDPEALIDAIMDYTSPLNVS